MNKMVNRMRTFYSPCGSVAKRTHSIYFVIVVVISLYVFAGPYLVNLVGGLWRHLSIYKGGNIWF